MDDNFDTEAGIDIDEFEAWLDEIADREGTSSETVLNKLISTYWIVNELSDVLEDIDDEGEHPASTEDTMDEALIEELSEALAGGAGLHPSGLDRPSSIDPGLIRLIETLQGKTEHYTAPKRPQREDSIDRLERTLSSIESKLEAISEPGEQVGAEEVRTLERRQDSLEELSQERVEAIEKKLDTVFTEVREALETTHQRTHELDTTIDQIESQMADLKADIDHETSQRSGEFSGLENELEALVESIEAMDEKVSATSRTQHNHGERLDGAIESFQEAIDNVEVHLQTLYAETENHNQYHARLLDMLDDRLVHLFQTKEAEDHLRHILEDAQKLGISSASCETCGERVDLGKLNRPECPHCGRVFEDVTQERNLLRKRNILQTMRPGSSFDVKSLESSLAARGEQNPEADGEDTIDLDLE